MKKKLVDYISDLHLNFYKLDILKFLLEEKMSDTLIISGDIGDYIDQNLELITGLSKHYKHILIVLGNHDYWLREIDIKNGLLNSFDKVAYTRLKYNEIKGVHCFNGDTITIDDIVFGGADSWYSRDYLLRHFKNKSSLSEAQNLWGVSINDSSQIIGRNGVEIDYLTDLFEVEYKKLIDIKNKTEVMVTHVNPSTKMQHQDQKFVNFNTTTFFNFDGSNIYKNSNIKYWFFGHTHTKIDYIIDGINFSCNPLGYPNQSAAKYKYIYSVLLEID